MPQQHDRYTCSPVVCPSSLRRRGRNGDVGQDTTPIWSGDSARYKFYVQIRSITKFWVFSKTDKLAKRGVGTPRQAVRWCTMRFGVFYYLLPTLAHCAHSKPSAGQVFVPHLMHDTVLFRHLQVLNDIRKTRWPF